MWLKLTADRCINLANVITVRFPPPGADGKPVAVLTTLAPADDGKLVLDGPDATALRAALDEIAVEVAPLPPGGPLGLVEIDEEGS